MNLKEKIGQTFIVGLDVPYGKNMFKIIDRIITEYKSGGICLYRKNYNNYEQLVEVINYIKDKSSQEKVPIFIAIDQEGGRVNRIPNDFLNLPSSYKLAKYSSDKNNLVTSAGNITGKILKELGFNMDFAPVLDIKRFSENHAIGDRAYSEKPEEVALYGNEYIKGLQKSEIVSVVKHFPGHGATSKDSHFTLPKIEIGVEELGKTDLIPFTKAIENGVDAILIGHLVIKNETKKLPATLSKRFITKYIRKKYRYNGLVITDDMRMKAIKFSFLKIRNPIRLALNSGNDMVMFKYIGNEQKEIKKIEAEMEKSINLARLNRKVNRILKIKEKYDVNTEQIKLNEEFRNKMNEEIKKIRKECKI